MVLVRATVQSVNLSHSLRALDLNRRPEQGDFSGTEIVWKQLLVEKEDMDSSDSSLILQRFVQVLLRQVSPKQPQRRCGSFRDWCRYRVP